MCPARNAQTDERRQKCPKTPLLPLLLMVVVVVVVVVVAKEEDSRVRRRCRAQR